MYTHVYLCGYICSILLLDMLCKTAFLAYCITLLRPAVNMLWNIQTFHLDGRWAITLLQGTFFILMICIYSNFFSLANTDVENSFNIDPQFEVSYRFIAITKTMWSYNYFILTWRTFYSELGVVSKIMFLL